MANMKTLTDAIAAMIPRVQSWPYFIQTQPLAPSLPPWIIVTITNDIAHVAESGLMTAGTGHVEIRIVADNVDSVNFVADDRMMATLCGATVQAEGFDVGALTLDSDSGAYAAGLDSNDTALRYIVRVLRFNFTWSRKQQ